LPKRVLVLSAIRVDFIQVSRQSDNEVLDGERNQAGALKTSLKLLLVHDASGKISPCGN
jgi:hypothetical protein